MWLLIVCPRRLVSVRRFRWRVILLVVIRMIVLVRVRLCRVSTMSILFTLRETCKVMRRRTCMGLIWWLPLFPWVRGLLVF